MSDVLFAADKVVNVVWQFSDVSMILLAMSSLTTRYVVRAGAT